MLDERLKAGRQREPATGSDHLLVGIKIAIPVLPSKSSYASVDGRSCVNDDCFDLPTFANRKNSIRKKSDIGDFEPYARKTAALYEKLITWTRRGMLRQIFWARAYVQDGDKGVYFLLDLVGTNSVF